MPKYVVEYRNGDNAAILEQQDNGTFAKIAFSAGAHNLESIMDLVNKANQATGN